MRSNDGENRENQENLTKIGNCLNVKLTIMVIFKTFSKKRGGFLTQVLFRDQKQSILQLLTILDSSENRLELIDCQK